MLSKCANSSCSNSFLYLNRGKLYRMELGGSPKNGASAPDFSAGTEPRRIEYFWLCHECAPRMTLTFKKGVGVKATPAPVARKVMVAGAD